MYKTMPQYRVEFFERLRNTLGNAGITLHVAYGRGNREDISLGVSAHYANGIEIHNRRISVGNREVLWQPCLRLAAKADLVIVEQASRLAVNNVLLLMQLMRLTRVGFWGHGVNLKKHTASRSGEFVKRIVSRYPHWWFAYTEGTKEHVIALGYPSSRITVVQNATNTEVLIKTIGAVGERGATEFRDAYDLGSGPIGIFLGSLYRGKRLPFLIDAGVHLARLRPDFKLVIAGDGPERHFVEDAARQFSWLRYVGRLERAQECAPALAAASFVLVPGSVGLVVLDSFAAAKPLVTTAINDHGPEIEYLRDGENGLIVADVDNAEAYARAIESLLDDGDRYDRLVSGCRRARTIYTLEAMVKRFTNGVIDALAA
ncbi:MAG: glycosyltransferase family 4 protein [Gaiellaceae bacterium]